MTHATQNAYFIGMAVLIALKSNKHLVYFYKYFINPDNYFTSYGSFRVYVELRGTTDMEEQNVRRQAVWVE